MLHPFSVKHAHMFGSIVISSYKLVQITPSVSDARVCGRGVDISNRKMKWSFPPGLMKPALYVRHGL